MITLRKALGYFITSIPLIAIFVVGCIYLGVLLTLVTFGIAAAVIGLVALGVYLTHE